jgi:penicillin V acylase-like amidase (Ntn superfamily)
MKKNLRLKMKQINRRWLLVLGACIIHFLYQIPAYSCTGISLKSKDGATIVARTVEWSLSDSQHNKLAIFPRHMTFTGMTPDGTNGKKMDWSLWFYLYDGIWSTLWP